MSFLHSRGLEKELIARGLLPAGCRLVEVSITPSSALVIRYEVYVQASQLAEFADAMKVTADEAIADDERNRIALNRQ